MIELLTRLGLTGRVHRVLAAIALAAACLALLWLWARSHDEKQQAAGASAQREGDLRETINRAEQGNAARVEIQDAFNRGDGRSAAVYDQCLRTARTPANCERFLPREQATDR
ncbi:hypothetical protein [Novosphingobium sp. ST904]|uniref:hypothetical protein n=1 Tax=Novosphingobium sp. ST904 TaxID=1684385 RepID=UPI001047FD28|nr:hypothetical protein [Novosphingobium sp. ST904]